MKTAQLTSLALFSASAMAGLLSKRGVVGKVEHVANPPVVAAVPDEAQTVFNDPSVDNLLFVPSVPGVATRDVIPEYIFMAQCLEAGFRGDCLVFGAPPGQCVSYFDYDSEGHDISGAYNNKVQSISTNTGGVCMLFKRPGCNAKGNDPGVTLSYAYDLCANQTGNTRPDDYSGDYCNKVTSWRC